MTIYLHIGLNKAGSSSLQAFCHDNREVLAEYGLEYPSAGLHGAAHFGFSKQLIGKPSAAAVPLPRDLDVQIREALEAKRNVMLSSEYFFLANDQQVGKIHRYLASFSSDCKVLVYLRRHDLWIASLFNQALKTTTKHSPWHSDIRDFTIHLLGSKETEASFPKILDRWATAFGAPNIVVRPFEPAQFLEGDLVWDALGSLMPKLPAALRKKGLKPRQVNSSLPENLLRVIDVVKGAEMSPEAKKKITATLVKEAQTAPKVKSGKPGWDARAFTLPLHLRKSILGMFEDDYRYVAQTYMGRADGQLFKDPVA